MIRPRYYSQHEQDNMTRQRPKTGHENLQGSTMKLANAVSTIGKMADKLDHTAASMEQFNNMTKMERTHLLVTNQDIDYAQSVVSKEAIPEIELLLKEAQALINEMGVQALEKQQKDQAIEQANKNGDSTMMSPPSPTRNEDYEKELLQVNEQMEACRIRWQALMEESDDMDDTLAMLDMELEQLDRELALQAAEAAVASEQSAMEIEEDDEEEDEEDEEDEEEDEEDNIRWLELKKEEARLNEELEMIRRQQQLELEQQQQQRQQQYELEQQQQQQMTEMKNNKNAQVALTKEEQLAIIQECMDHLQSSPDDIDLLDINDLKSYLAALQDENNKIMSTLESKIATNRTLLKTYCRNILPNKGMGYVARQLVDHLFTDQGYKELTPTELIKLFDSPRHKVLVQQFLDRYPLPSID